MSVEPMPGASDYDKLSQINGLLKHARENGMDEVREALADAAARIKQRLNDAKPPHESLAHFQRKQVELAE
eukprot:5712103-Alexandrium_andersonii.AAC.1